MYFIVKKGEACCSRLVLPPFTPIGDETLPISELGKWTRGEEMLEGSALGAGLQKVLSIPFPLESKVRRFSQMTLFPCKGESKGVGEKQEGKKY